jgi:hypothetical protein
MIAGLRNKLLQPGGSVRVDGGSVDVSRPDPSRAARRVPLSTRIPESSHAFQVLIGAPLLLARGGAACGAVWPASLNAGHQPYAAFRGAGLSASAETTVSCGVSAP